MPERMRTDADIDGELHEVDHFLRSGAEEMRAEDFVGFGIDDRLEDADGIPENLRFWDGGSLEPHDAHVVACRARFVLGHADARERGIEENGIGDGAAIFRRARARADELLAHDAEVVERDVGELQSARDVAHRPNVRDVCPQMFVHGDGAARRRADACRREVQTLDVRLASRGEEHGVGGEGLCACGGLYNNCCLRSAVLDSLRRGGGQNPYAACLECRSHACRDLGVLARDEVCAVLNDRDLRTKIRVVRSELKPDIAAADNDETARERIELHHGLARIAAGALRDARNIGHDRHGAGIDEDACGVYLCLRTVSRRHADGMRVDKTCRTVDDVRTRARDFIVILLPQHGGEPPFFGDGGGVARRLLVKRPARCGGESRAVLERFRRDAGDVDACAAVAQARLLDERGPLAAFCEETCERLARFAESDDEVLYVYLVCHEEISVSIFYCHAIAPRYSFCILARPMPLVKKSRKSCDKIIKSKYICPLLEIHTLG